MVYDPNSIRRVWGGVSASALIPLPRRQSVELGEKDLFALYADEFYRYLMFMKDVFHSPMQQDRKRIESYRVDWLTWLNEISYQYFEDYRSSILSLSGDFYVYKATPQFAKNTIARTDLRRVQSAKYNHGTIFIPTQIDNCSHGTPEQRTNCAVMTMFESDQGSDIRGFWPITSSKVGEDGYGFGITSPAYFNLNPDLPLTMSPLVADVIASLLSMNVLDEDTFTAIEQQMQEEAWADDLHQQFYEELVHEWDHELDEYNNENGTDVSIDDIGEQDLLAMFEDAMHSANLGWGIVKTDYGYKFTADAESAARAVSRSAIEDQLGITL